MGNCEYTHLPQWIAVRVSLKRWAVCQLAEQNGSWKVPDYTAVFSRLTERQAEEKLAELQSRERVPGASTR